MTALRNGQPWTAAEDAQLCAMLTEGLRYAEIAQRLKRPSVEHRIAKLNWMRARTRTQEPAPTLVIYRTRCGCTRVEPVQHGWTPEHDMAVPLGDGRERRFRWCGERSASGLPIYDEVV